MEMPAPVLAGLYVVAYAHVDDSVRFEQTYALSVDGQWLGAVPNLAICQELDSREYAIQYCTEEWEPVGIAAGYASREEAMRRIEQSYHGIGTRWVDASITFEEAKALHDAELRAESCSFCGKTTLEVSQMVAVETASEARICNHCIDRFHASIHQDE